MKNNWLNILSIVKELHEKTAALNDFTPWPTNLEFSQSVANSVPITERVVGFQQTGDQNTQPLIDAIKEIAPHANWQQMYSEEEVGRYYLDRFGYFELIGPKGVFHSSEMQAYISYWDKELFYDWHYHEAQELYFILSGQATFKTEGQVDRILETGESHAHESNQHHALRTDDYSILTYVLWRGAGIGQSATMKSKTK